MDLPQLSNQDLLLAFEKMGLTIETDGPHFVHQSIGRQAGLIQTLVTIDDDNRGASIVATLVHQVATDRRGAVHELLNLVHGQSVWHFRCFLDEEGHVLTVGKLELWDLPFNPVQFSEVFYTIVVTADRLFPCLQAIASGKSVAEAFEHFFVEREV
jgi:hypothetical protein